MSFSGLCRPLLAYEDQATVELAASTTVASPACEPTKSERDTGCSKEIGYSNDPTNAADSCAKGIPYAELLRISEEMRKAVTIRDRWYRLRVYGACFIGSEAVDWLVSSTTCKDRAEAVAVGNRLLSIGLFHHVVDQHEFEDGYLFYRYFVDEHRGYRLMFPLPWG